MAPFIRIEHVEAVNRSRPTCRCPFNISTWPPRFFRGHPIITRDRDCLLQAPPHPTSPLFQVLWRGVVEWENLPIEEGVSHLKTGCQSPPTRVTTHVPSP